jgi:hypothetical protein
MYGPVALTHVVYVFIVVAFLATLTFAFTYNLRQKRKLREAERNGSQPQSVESGILLAQRQTRMDAGKKPKPGT